MPIIYIIRYYSIQLKNNMSHTPGNHSLTDVLKVTRYIDFLVVVG